MKKESDYYNALYIFPLFMEGIFLCLPECGHARVGDKLQSYKQFFQPIKRQLMQDLVQFRNQYRQLFTFLFRCNLLCIFFMLKLTV